MISQRYVTFKLDTADTFTGALLEEDTVSISNEFKATAAMSINHRGERTRLRNRLHSSFGTENMFIRNNFDIRRQFSQFDLVIRDRFEFSTPWDSESSRRSYIKNRVSTELQRQIKEPISVRTRFQLENKSYTKEFRNAYDYSIIDLDGIFAYSYIGYLNYRYSLRNVPDSTEANYNQHNLILSYDLLGNITASFYGSVSHRSHPNSDRSDYLKYYLTVMPQIPITNTLTLQPGYELDKYDYDKQSLVDISYARHTIRLLGNLSLSTSFDVGTGFSVLLAKADSVYDGETYHELAIPLESSVFKAGKLWLDFRLQPGRRFYQVDDDEVFSDYYFVNIDGMATYWITRKLKLSIFGYYSPEWHKVSVNDFSLSYISTSITYSF